jgi:hypothetical protein
VVIETFVSGRIRCRILGAVSKKAQDSENALDRIDTRDPATHDAYRIASQREPHGRDARVGAGLRLVSDQTGDGMGLMQEILEGVALQGIEPCFAEVGECRIGIATCNCHRIATCGVIASRTAGVAPYSASSMSTINSQS